MDWGSRGWWGLGVVEVKWEEGGWVQSPGVVGSGRWGSRVVRSKG